MKISLTILTNAHSIVDNAKITYGAITKCNIIPRECKVIPLQKKEQKAEHECKNSSFKNYGKLCLNPVKKITHPIFVDWPIVTAFPMTDPDPICTLAPTTDFEWTTAPISMSAVRSMQAEWWIVPPPLCHVRNPWQFTATSFSTLQTKEREV